MIVYRPTFISHAHADNELCDHYAATLRARGIDVWYDRDNAQIGHFLGDVIQHELEQRSAFVLLMTQAALDSFWVKLELQAFLGLMGRDASRFLLPVRIGPCTVPPLLNGLLWVDALSMSFDKAIDTIANALILPDAALAPQSQQSTSTVPTLPTLGPAPVPANSTSTHHLTPMSLSRLGFRGYAVNGVEFILPPLCPVPSGVFIMGSDKAKDSQARDDETPQYPVEVGPFALGRHPVTVAEYACAVRAEAVCEPPQGAFRLITWAEQLERLDHPVVCVSWQDAAAYLRWLAQITGQPWRLPSEAEWEKAARWDGRSSRIYPWGDTFDRARCNTSDGTIPVGSSTQAVPVPTARRIWATSGSGPAASL